MGQWSSGGGQRCWVLLGTKIISSEPLPCLLVLQDNAQLHVAWVCRYFLDGVGIDARGWPSCSPDLNPIRYYESVHPTLPSTTTDSPVDHSCFDTSLGGDPQDTIQHLIRSVPKCWGSKPASGGHTHYWATFWHHFDQPTISISNFDFWCHFESSLQRVAQFGFLWPLHVLFSAITLHAFVSVKIFTLNISFIKIKCAI